MRALVAEVLARNPDVARARHAAAAALSRLPQARGLEDPRATLQVFPLPPETRAGPQRVMASASQKLPWRGKRRLRAEAASHAAEAARLRIEAEALRVLTEGRRLLYELAFLERLHAILDEERLHFMRHEEAARARYVAGVGLQQSVVKIQAAITRAETELLALESRQESLRAAFNALRDLPAGEPFTPPPLPAPDELPQLDAATLLDGARARRPELLAAAAEIAGAASRVELAAKDFRPDVTVGLGYTVVDRRRDRAARLNPPEDDGDDVLMLSGSVNLPIYRGRLEAALEERLALERSAAADQRRAEAAIAAAIGEHAARLPLLYRQWQLLDGVLLAQAEEALRSAESAYATGELGALDLLDAEHVLFEVRTARDRVRADYAVACARLERAIAAPLAAVQAQEPTP